MVAKRKRTGRGAKALHEAATWQVVKFPDGSFHSLKTAAHGDSSLATIFGILSGEDAPKLIAFCVNAGLRAPEDAAEILNVANGLSDLSLHWEHCQIRRHSHTTPYHTRRGLVRIIKAIDELKSALGLSSDDSYSSSGKTNFPLSPAMEVLAAAANDAMVSKEMSASQSGDEGFSVAQLRTLGVEALTPDRMKMRNENAKVLRAHPEPNTPRDVLAQLAIHLQKARLLADIAKPNTLSVNSIGQFSSPLVEFIDALWRVWCSANWIARLKPHETTPKPQGRNFSKFVDATANLFELPLPRRKEQRRQALKNWLGKASRERKSLQTAQKPR